MKFKTSLMYSTLAALLLCSAGLAARDLPSYYPDSFQHKGVVGRLDTAKRIIVIGDGLYPLATSVKVHNPMTEFSTLSSVKPGAMVGVGFSEMPRPASLPVASGGRLSPPPAKLPMNRRRPDLQKKVNEIWILPDNYKPFRRKH